MTLTDGLFSEGRAKMPAARARMRERGWVVFMVMVGGGCSCVIEERDGDAVFDGFSFSFP